MKQLVAAVLFFFCVTSSHAQVFGGNPPSLRWKQIDTDTLRVIYPEGLDSTASRIASIIHYEAAHTPATLGNQLRKVNVVLQNQTVIPNAYVGLSPFRSEFFMTPLFNNFDLGSTGWAEGLALHEYRHVMQFNNFRNGISKAMYFLFGEDGLALGINAAVPDWFFEGDAVYQETILSNQGRGRLPLFMNAYPALWQASKKYSWQKLRNGSLKDYVPNHYYLGYLLVNYGRIKYGEDFWTKVTHDASAFKGLFYPFQHAIKKYTGISYQQFRDEALFHYKSERTLQLGERPPGKAVLPVNKKFVTSYYFPFRIGGDSLLYLKASRRTLPAFYVHDANGEHKIRTKDIAIDDHYSYRNGTIVYAAYESDPRWGWRDHSVIRLLDVHTGQQRSLTIRSKYFTPDISPDGNSVAAVLSDADGSTAIHWLDAQTGEKKNVLRSAEIQLFTDLKFVDDHSLVTAVRLNNGQMALALADLNNGVITRLTSPSYSVVGYPSVQGRKVYFTASYSGNDEIFVLDLDTQVVQRLTSSGMGNYFVNASGNKITWSVFTAEGYQLRQDDINSFQPSSIDVSSKAVAPVGYKVALADRYHDILNDSVPNRKFVSSKYKKGTRLINIHSWRPNYSDPEFSFSLYGQNVLNTFQTETYYLYNGNEKTSAVGMNAIYGAGYPFLNFGTQYTFDRNTVDGNRIRHWDQLDLSAGLSIPLNYAKGRMFRSFTAGTDIVLRNEYNKGFYFDSAGNTNFAYLHHYVSASSQSQVAAQQIYPRSGYAVSLHHRYAISRYNGYQFIGNAALFLPGFASTHSIILRGSFQQRDTLNPGLFSDAFPYARGYEGRYFSRMWRLSGNYHFPIWCPDFGIGNIVYLQRLRANIFYDFTKVYSRDKLTTRDQRSVGAEFFFDTRWWNEYPLTFGIRISRLLDPDQFDGFKGTVVQIVLPVSILPR